MIVAWIAVRFGTQFCLAEGNGIANWSVAVGAAALAVWSFVATERQVCRAYEYREVFQEDAPASEIEVCVSVDRSYSPDSLFVGAAILFVLWLLTFSVESLLPSRRYSPSLLLKNAGFANRWGGYPRCVSEFTCLAMLIVLFAGKLFKKHTLDYHFFSS